VTRTKLSKLAIALTLAEYNLDAWMGLD